MMRAVDICNTLSFFSSLCQLQCEAPPEASRVHFPSGEASELGGKLLRSALRHPDTGPIQNGKCMHILLWSVFIKSLHK